MDNTARFSGKCNRESYDEIEITKKSKGLSSTVLNLPQVHASPRPSNTSSFQSLLQRTPKLHQYSPDQLEIVILRRTGAVEHISPRSKHRRRVETSQNLSTSQKDNAEPMIVNGTKSKLSDAQLINNSHEDTLSSLSFERECTLCSSDPKEEIATPNGLSTTIDDDATSCFVDSPCPTCDVLDRKAEELQHEVVELKKSLHETIIKLRKSQLRLKEVTKQNFHLKAAESGMRHGLTHIAKIIKDSNDESEKNDARIAELLNRAWPQREVLPSSSQ